MPVDTAHPEYLAAYPRWVRCRDCYEGEDVVKAAGTKYLPMLDSHKRGKADYSEYILRAMFYNATGRTVDGLAGALYQKAPEIKISTPFESLLEDITLKGESLEMFALDATQEILTVGRFGILVEMPLVGDTLTRPYWVPYRAEAICNWRSERVNGEEILTLVVLRDDIQKIDVKDVFTIELVKRYRVLYLREGRYMVDLWEQEEDKNGQEVWVKVETIVPQKRGEPLSTIPFIFMNPFGTSTSIAKPPLLDLVNMNLSHYLTMAQLEHGRHFTALPTPWVAGVASVINTGGSTAQPILTLGSGTAWILGDQGRAGMLEFSGAGLQSLVTAAEHKEKLMAVLGARLLEQQHEGPEATVSVVSRHTGEHATLRTIAQSTEQGLTRALRLTVFWAGSSKSIRETRDGQVEVNKEYLSTRMDSAELSAVTMAMQAGGMSYETYYMNLQRGGLTRPGVTAEEEKQLIDDASEESLLKQQEIMAAGGLNGPNDKEAKDDAKDEEV